MTLTDL